MDTATKSKPRRLAVPAFDPRVMCSCALSRKFPFCDGSQMISRSNRAGELVSCGTPAAPRPEAKA